MVQWFGAWNSVLLLKRFRVSGFRSPPDGAFGQAQLSCRWPIHLCRSKFLGRRSSDFWLRACFTATALI